MVYKLFSDGMNESPIRKTQSKVKKRKLKIQTESIFTDILLKCIKILLLVYDIISLPIYFVLQRPDKRARAAQRTRSERIDINTWIKTDPNPDDKNYLLNGLGWSYNLSQDSRTIQPRIQHKHMGSTLSDIFANSIKKFSSRSCLGYRAVVTCPVLILNEEGQHVLQDKSFRSDYTWYTYEQIGRRVQDIASGLYFHSLQPKSRALFIASTSLEWFIASQSCFQLSAQLVIAPEVNDQELLACILKESGVSTIFTSHDKLGQLCALFETMKQDMETNHYHLKSVILIDCLFPLDFSEPLLAKLKESSKGVADEIISIGQVEEAGVENPIELVCTKYLNEEPTPYEDTLLIDKTRQELYERPEMSKYTFEKHLEIRLKEEIPNTVPIRRRSTMGKTLPASGKKFAAATSRRITVAQRPDFDKQINYTLKNYRQELDSRSTSPRLSISERIKLKDGEFSTKPHDLGIIVYTHGTLGQLKAVKLTHNHLARCNHYIFLDGLLQGEDKHCTVLPLDNLIEFMTEMCVFSHGGSIGYSCNQNTLFYDGKELFKRDLSDLEALSPSFLLARPYDLERLRTSIQNYINLKLNPLKSFLLVGILYDYKKFWARRHFESPIVNRIFCNELKHLFGTSLKYILCNGATDCFETKDFFTFMVNVPVIELYGPEEAIVSLISVNDIWDYKRRVKSHSIKCGYSFYNWKWGDRGPDYDSDEQDDFKDIKLMPPRVNKNTFKEDSSRNLLITSSILCPTIGTRIRLEDWEDFRTSDHPYSRGRLVIGGDNVCNGYLQKNLHNKASDTFYVDSNFIKWFRTEDIVRVFPNGSFEIISAITDMIKMVDGQFISLSQIESILRNSQFVDNVCAICGDDRKFVIALVVPNLRRLALKSPGEANLKMAIGTESEPEELIDVEFRREVCNDRLLSEFVDRHLNELLAKKGFQSIPSRFYLVPEIWTPETELVTPSFEPKRSAIQKYYAVDIQSIFKMNFDKSRSRLSARRLRERKLSHPNKENNSVCSHHLAESRLSY